MRGPISVDSLVSGGVAGYWQERNIVIGAEYTVVKDFVDADGDLHAVGKTWKIVACDFSKFDNEISLYVLMDDVCWLVVLVWQKSQQAMVIENWDQYLLRS